METVVDFALVAVFTVVLGREFVAEKINGKTTTEFLCSTYSLRIYKYLFKKSTFSYKTSSHNK